MGRADKILRNLEQKCGKAVADRVVAADVAVHPPRVSVKLLRVKEFAQLYGVSESTVREWIKKGKVQFEQPAGKRGRIFLHE